MSAISCYLNAPGILCSAGATMPETAAALTRRSTDLTLSDHYFEGHPLPLGLYRGELPEIPLPDRKWQSRNNRFALAALEQIDADVKTAVKRYGAARIGVVIGSSTSGISDTEIAIGQWMKSGSSPPGYDYGLQEMGAPAQFIAELLGLGGPCYGISTACSSGAKALASARRLIAAGLCDAVIAGGVDTLCRLTVQGFASLEAVSDSRCNPMSLNRNGINVGEGAALFLVSRVPEGVELKGIGESSDAYHISAPEPGGSGAIDCMSRAVANAGIDVTEVGYINMHGTATALNDRMEANAIATVFGTEIPCSSTKPFTGHTLGAAGAIEAAICWMALTPSLGHQLPPHLWDGERDPDLAPLRLVETATESMVRVDHVLSNNFAFGGNNISLLFGRVA